MLMLIRSITPDTLCPSLLGGPVGRYPRTIDDGEPVTMPGPASGWLTKPSVMLAQRGDAYLVQPRVGQVSLAPPACAPRLALAAADDRGRAAEPDTEPAPAPNPRSALLADSHTEWSRLRLVPPIAG